MGNYEYQYKKYYQELHNKNVKNTFSPVYKSSSFQEIYGVNKGKVKKKDFFSSMANVFIYQLVVVMFMLMAAFYLKYTPIEQDHYENIKAVINSETYTIDKSVTENFDIFSILNKIKDYIKLNLNGEEADF